MEERIVKDIKRVAAEMGLVPGRDNFSFSEYLANGGKFSDYSIHDGGSTWSVYCFAAGFGNKAIKRVSDDEYFENLNKAYQALGRFPKASELKKFGLIGVRKRWSPIKALFDEAIKKGKISGYSEKSSPVIPGKVESLCKVEMEEKKNEEARLIPPIPRLSKRKRWERSGVIGFPYAPQEETGLIVLFAILCSQGHIDWQILDLTNKGIDAICYIESERREVRVEFKNILSRAGWNHSFDDFDYLVCWESRWKDFPKPVIEVKKLIANL